MYNGTLKEESFQLGKSLLKQFQCETHRNMYTFLLSRIYLEEKLPHLLSHLFWLPDSQRPKQSMLES